ncbi:MAG: adenine nucleotide alpha hydrolase [Vicinamibacteria bacterium]|nr:adenine nucleotide alpha hydrolase [Vicinamibacteria bacterium]
MTRALLAWSSGKDSAHALHVLRERGDVEVVGLLTTFNATHDRVAMHAVRRELVRAQAAAVALPLVEVEIPWPCPNGAYETAMAAAMADAKARGVEAVAFGDLFLADVRRYREERLAPTGLQPLFPLWGRDTRSLAREILDSGVRAVLTCVDPRALDARFAGRAFDEALLAELPASVDACGENGEFHSFVWDSPQFAAPLAVATGEVIEREGFVFADVRPAAAVPA